MLVKSLLGLLGGGPHVSKRSSTSTNDTKDSAQIKKAINNLEKLMKSTQELLIEINDERMKNTCSEIMKTTQAMTINFELLISHLEDLVPDLLDLISIIPTGTEDEFKKIKNTCSETMKE